MFRVGRRPGRGAGMAGLALDGYAVVGRLGSRVSRISAIGESQLALSAELTIVSFACSPGLPRNEFFYEYLPVFSHEFRRGSAIKPSA